MPENAELTLDRIVRNVMCAPRNKSLEQRNLPREMSALFRVRHLAHVVSDVLVPVLDRFAASEHGRESGGVLSLVTVGMVERVERAEKRTFDG